MSNFSGALSTGGPPSLRNFFKPAGQTGRFWRPFRLRQENGAERRSRTAETRSLTPGRVCPCGFRKHGCLPCPHSGKPHIKEMGVAPGVFGGLTGKGRSKLLMEERIRKPTLTPRGGKRLAAYPVFFGTVPVRKRALPKMPVETPKENRFGPGKEGLWVRQNVA